MENKNMTVSLTLPNAPEFVSVARLALSGVADRMGFDVDDIEDLKVAVSEACTNALKHGSRNQDGKYFVHYTIEGEKLIIEVCDDGRGIDVENIKNPDLEHPKESGLGLYIIQTLMDEVEITNRKDNGASIRMIKNMRE